MAGDWIKMRIDLYEDPAVIEMADRLEVREEVVVGYLHRVWSFLSRQCHDGSVTGVTLVSLGRVTNLPGFAEMMRDVGWLTYRDTHETPDGRPVITIPKWDRHLSQSSKQRALTSERKRRQRVTGVTDMSRSQRDKSVTREEKRREEIKKKEKPPSAAEVESYIHTIEGCSVNASEFVAYYEQRDWKTTSGDPVTNWKAAVDYWHARSRKEIKSRKKPDGKARLERLLNDSQ